MKFDEITIGQIKTTVKRMGGMENFIRFLSGQGKIVFDSLPVRLYELYRHTKQFYFMKGRELEKHLHDCKPEAFQVSLDSVLVRDWLADPTTYPEELREIFPCLWGSITNCGPNRRRLPVLVYRSGNLSVDWVFSGQNFGANAPALLIIPQSDNN